MVLCLRLYLSQVCKIDAAQCVIWSNKWARALNTVLITARAPNLWAKGRLRCGVSGAATEKALSALVGEGSLHIYMAMLHRRAAHKEHTRVTCRLRVSDFDLWWHPSHIYKRRAERQGSIEEQENDTRETRTLQRQFHCIKLLSHYQTERYNWKMGRCWFDAFCEGARYRSTKYEWSLVRAHLIWVPHLVHFAPGASNLWSIYKMSFDCVVSLNF